MNRGQIAVQDKRPREVKQHQIKQNSKSRWISSIWKSKARKVNEERYEFYLAKGNARKADIYGRKIGKV